MARLKYFSLFLIPTGPAWTENKLVSSSNLISLYRGYSCFCCRLWGHFGRRGGGRDLREEGCRDDGDPDLHNEYPEPAAPEHVEPDLHDDESDRDSLSRLLFTGGQVAVKVLALKLS